MIRQTLAIFVEAYRELNAKKLFWIVLGLSLLCVAALACIGIYEYTGPDNVKHGGFSVLFWKFPVEILDSFSLSRKLFYNWLFFTFGFKIWLTWAATILALISTAGIIPDFITGGAIEMSLSKPIGRLRLFLTKYFAGLTFVAVQVAIFSVAAFLVIGIRSGSWEPVLFLAIPIVLAFFSYLYAFMVLLGMLTRSTIASLLITILLWLCIFALHTAEAGPLLQAKIRQDQAVAIREADISKLQSQIEQRRAAKASPQPEQEAESEPSPPPKPAAKSSKTLAQLETELADKTTRLEDVRQNQKRLTDIHAILFAAKTILPKTTETMELLRRPLISLTEIESIVGSGDNERSRRFGPRDPLEPPPSAVMKEMQRELNSRSIGWVLGTSLAFEALAVAIAAAIFCRRDF